MLGKHSVTPIKHKAECSHLIQYSSTVISLKQATMGILYWCLAITCCGCAASVEDQFQPVDKSVYLVSHGWHAGLVLRRADIHTDDWPENVDFPEAEFYEIGWGDQQFYLSPDAHLGVTLRAALWPTPSVLHIVGFRDVLTTYFPFSEIIEFKLSEPNFTLLVRYIGASFARDDNGQVQALGNGLYGDSQFYLSRESYHLFRTCNVWTAKALNTANIPITPLLSMTVEQLMDQAQTYGKVVQEKPVTPEEKNSALQPI